MVYLPLSCWQEEHRQWTKPPGLRLTCSERGLSCCIWYFFTLGLLPDVWSERILLSGDFQKLFSLLWHHVILWSVKQKTSFLWLRLCGCWGLWHIYCYTLNFVCLEHLRWRENSRLVPDVSLYPWKIILLLKLLSGDTQGVVIAFLPLEMNDFLVVFTWSCHVDFIFLALHSSPHRCEHVYSYSDVEGVCLKSCLMVVKVISAQLS